jgi:hypothetical protein
MEVIRSGIGGEEGLNGSWRRRLRYHPARIKISGQLVSSLSRCFSSNLPKKKKGDVLVAVVTQGMTFFSEAGGV